MLRVYGTRISESIHHSFTCRTQYNLTTWHWNIRVGSIPCVHVHDLLLLFIVTTPGPLELVCPLSLHTATKCCAGLGSGSDWVFRCLIPRDTGGPCSHLWFDIIVGAVFFIKNTIMVDWVTLYTENSEVKQKSTC